MLHGRAALGLVFCVALGSGCSAEIELRPEDETEPEDEEELPECTPDLTPRVEDCARGTSDAVPVARVTGDGFHFAADQEFLYYIDDFRPVRLSMSGGEPEALTPHDSAGQDIKYADGFVYWTGDDVLFRVPATGGDPEPLLELEHGSHWAIAGDYILSAGPYVSPSAVYRTSMTTKETTEILAEDPEQPVWDIGVGTGRALVARMHSVVSVPLEGGEPQVLSDRGAGGLQPPFEHDGQAYYVGSAPLGGNLATGTVRVDIDKPSTPELFMPGYGLAYAVDDDALYAHIIPQPTGGEMNRSRVVRAPFSGEEPAFVTYTSSTSGSGWNAWSNGLVVSGCNVYFIEKCDDGDPNELRIVTTSKVP
ncbi:MAG: hypothetical protein HOV80_10825 [Polyangiaceae bacterium]|nr:hypothetical protein [Polyangiaceae bacterium]